MPSWIEEYAAALDVRDRRELSNAATIDAYTRLADRTAALEAASLEAPATHLTNVPEEKPAGSYLPTRILGSPRSPPPAAQESSNVASLRTDLATANRSKALLEAKVAEITAQLSALEASLKEQQADATALKERVALLEKERAALQRKLKDRDSELREKARLVENVQDEMLGLEMQTNMAEQRATQLQQENKELVDRWMKRMGKEADRMNEGSGWT